MFCYKCGQQLSDGVNFCFSCGARIPSAANFPQNSSVVGKIQLRCNTCGGTLIGNANSPILNCPFCHSTEMIVESEAVKVQRLRSDEKITIALDKTSTARQMANDARDFEREKRNTLTIKGKITLVAGIISLVVVIVLFILAMNSEFDEAFWYGTTIFLIAMGWAYYGIAQMPSQK